MKILILAVFLAGCANLPGDTKAFHTARYNFTYKIDFPIDQWAMFTDTTKAFYGDCEDFAFSLQNVIGGKVMYTINDYGHHAVLLKNNTVYDSSHKWPIKVKNYPNKLLFELLFDGVVINN